MKFEKWIDSQSFLISYIVSSFGSLNRISHFKLLDGAINTEYVRPEYVEKQFKASEEWKTQKKMTQNVWVYSFLFGSVIDVINWILNLWRNNMSIKFHDSSWWLRAGECPSLEWEVVSLNPSLIKAVIFCQSAN